MADTVIRRSIGGTIVAAAVSLASAVGAIAAFSDGNWILGILVACVAVGSGFMAFIGPKKAKCPHCGRTMSADSSDPSSVNHCRACGQYSRAENGALVRVAPDYFGRNAVFPVHLDRLIKPGLITGLPRSDMHDVRWPNICIVCNAPATRVDPVDVSVSRMSGPVTTRLSLRFPFPCCASHHVGADMSENELWSGDGFECDRAQLRFQSYRFWREFCRLNSIDQRRAEQSS